MKLYTLTLELLHANKKQLFQVAAKDKKEALDKARKYVEEVLKDKARFSFEFPREVTGIFIP